MIRAARKEAGMTQSQLAASIGVSQALISYYESDTEAPVSALSEIAQATGHELVVRFEKKCEKKSQES